MIEQRASSILRKAIVWKILRPRVGNYFRVFRDLVWGGDFNRMGAWAKPLGLFGFDLGQPP